MSGARIRLGVALFLFVGWLSYLAMLATQARSIIVSRSQLAVATTMVIAEVQVDADGRPTDEVTIVEILKAGPLNDLRPGQLQVIADLDNSRVPYTPGFPGSDQYLLLLRGDAENVHLASPPPSPGHRSAARPWIYPWNEQLRSQLDTTSSS